jgi:CDGSH-type Zn-finger protein
MHNTAMPIMRLIINVGVNRRSVNHFRWETHKHVLGTSPYCREVREMADVTIKIMDKGPLYVTGGAKLIDTDGNAFEAKEAFALCRCGQSGNKPFCDGGHMAAGFSDCARAKQVL